MYERKNSGTEGLTPWQLINKTYEMLVVESRSLVGVVRHRVADAGTSRHEYKMATIKISHKIKTVMFFLESLLVDGEEFSHTMASLYSWYLENLDLLVNDELSASERKIAAKNLITQAEGFVDIWSGMDGDK